MNKSYLRYTVLVISALVLISGVTYLILSGKALEPKRTFLQAWNPNELRRVEQGPFAFSLPTGWRLASNGNSDKTISLDFGQNGSSITVELSEPLDDTQARSMIRGYRESFNGPLVQDATETQVAFWGNLPSTGFELNGTLVGSGDKGGVRVTIARSGQNTLLVTETWFGPEKMEIARCSELIASSLNLRKP